MQNDLSIRRAAKEDVPHIENVLSYYAKKKLLLPRTADNIIRFLDNFIVAEINGQFAGCTAIRDFGGNLFEVRSLAVASNYSNRGIGSKLVDYAIRQLQTGENVRVFALTYRVQFFVRLGFCKVSKNEFPEKIWSDCNNCPKKDHCDEEAVLLDLSG